MQGQTLHTFIVDKIDDLKGRDIVVLDVRGKSSITDCMIICSGNSNRHVCSIADHVAEELRHAGLQPLGIEGEAEGEWVLVDMGDVIVHVMQDDTRALYQLEKLWSGNFTEAAA
ncbi:MAG: ribosome silencing factor [Aeromonadaceae bacterium]|nr:ribosome silencing factor [Aeromonadaceae bacterium]